MTAGFIIGLALILAAASGAVWLIHHIYSKIVDTLSADNIDLRNRLFIAKGIAPSGVDVTAQYQDKRQDQQQRQTASRENAKKPAGPLARLRDGWAAKDRKMAHEGIDVTSTGNH